MAPTGIWYRCPNRCTTLCSRLVSKHVIAQNINRAKQNASDPKAYRYYMNQAALYKRYNVNNPDMDQRIRQSLTAPELQRLERHIKRLRTSPVLKTDEVMKHYQNLQIERERRYKVLEDSEHEKFRQLINNPSNNITLGPEFVSDTPYHSRVVKSFLAAHPDMIQNDVTGNLYVMGKKILDDPKQAVRIIHFITHDYSDLRKTREGTSAVLNATRKRGFDIKDIGKTYLREHLQRKLTEKRERRQHQQQSGTTPSGAAPSTPSSSSATIPRTRTPLSPITTPKTTSTALSQLQRLNNEMSKRLTPSSQRHQPSKEDQETPNRKRRRKEGSTKYYLRSKTEKEGDDRPRKTPKRKHKKKLSNRIYSSTRTALVHIYGLYRVAARSRAYCRRSNSIRRLLCCVGYYRKGG